MKTKLALVVSFLLLMVSIVSCGDKTDEAAASSNYQISLPDVSCTGDKCL